jgi:muconolactone delta-isomerase
MQLSVTSNFADIKRLLDAQQKQAVFAAAVALNRSAEQAVKDIRDEQRKVFDRPTPWFLNALRISPRATKQKLEARIWFKDRNSVESSRDMLMPHIEGGDRARKAMEQRLQRIGVLLPAWRTVPGEGATLDAYGNMSRGEISLILNYVGAYTEAGYNKVNVASKAKFKKGTRSKRGFEFFIARVGNRQGLQPGVYRKTHFGFGSSIKPVLVFVSQATYRRRLDFYGIAKRTVDRVFPADFGRAYEQALRTAR